MSRNNVSATATASAGTGFFGLLTLAFIILKLFKHSFLINYMLFEGINIFS